MSNLKIITICSLIIVLLAATVPLYAEPEEKSVPLKVGPITGTNFGQWALQGLCQDELDKQCRRLKPISFNCEDGLSSGPWLDFDSVTFRAENFIKPFPGDPAFEMDIYCFGNCIAVCDDPLPKPDPIDCFATNEVYCNNACPGRFRDENGATAGRCELIPDGSGNGTNCWGCRNTITGEFWKRPRGGGSAPNDRHRPDVRIRYEYDDDFDWGSSGGASGCDYYIEEFVGYEDIVVDGEIIQSPVYEVTCVEN